jgi:hypothetical protein
MRSWERAMKLLLQIMLSAAFAITVDFGFKYQIQITRAISLRQRLPLGYKIWPWTKIVAMVSYMVPANIMFYYRISPLSVMGAWFVVAVAVYVIYAAYLYNKEMAKS